MAIIATDGNRFSAVVKREFDPASAYCRDVVTYNGTAVTLQVGAVLGKFLASPTLTAGAVVGTGNGTVGTISIVSTASTRVGVYTAKFTAATAYELIDPNGAVQGVGATGVPFNGIDGLTFTITAGGTAFVAGDYIPLTVAGTVKYKLVEATATDGSQIASNVYIADQLGLSHPLLTVVNTDTTLLTLSRGPSIVDASQLSFGASVTGAALTAAYAQLKTVGIIAETQV